MKTVGNLIREARTNMNLTREELGEMTHIKTNFIGAIERGDWEKLPDFSIVLGFVKVIAHFLDIDELQAVSLFRREYPPKLKRFLDSARNDKVGTKEIGKKFVWGPRLTFLVGIIIIIFIVLGYLGFQYKNFSASPILVVDQPTEGQSVNVGGLEVKGKTDPDATVTVNDQAIVVNTDGSFDSSLEVSNSTGSIKITAKSRSGKMTVISRTIKVKP